MKVAITGGGDLIGSRLAKALLERGTLAGPSGEQEDIDEMVLSDTRFPDAVKAIAEQGYTTGLTLLIGDIADDLWNDEVDGRSDDQRLHAQRIRRRTGGSFADRDRSPRKTERGGFELGQGDVPGTARRRNVPLAGTSGSVASGDRLPRRRGFFHRPTLAVGRRIRAIRPSSPE